MKAQLSPAHDTSYTAASGPEADTLVTSGPGHGICEAHSQAAEWPCSTETEAYIEAAVAAIKVNNMRNRQCLVLTSYLAASRPAL